jgi:hypothetical protein
MNVDNIWIGFPQESDEIRNLMEAYDIGGFDSAEKYDRWPAEEYEYDSDNYGYDSVSEQY